MVFTYAAWAKYGVISLTAKGLALQKTKLLKELAIRCKDLVSLQLFSGGALRQSLLDATSRAAKLRHLWVGAAVPVEPLVVAHIMDSCISLETARFDEIVQSATRELHLTEPLNWVWSREDFSNLKEFTAGFVIKIMNVNLVREPARRFGREQRLMIAT